MLKQPCWILDYLLSKLSIFLQMHVKVDNITLAYARSAAK